MYVVEIHEYKSFYTFRNLFYLIFFNILKIGVKHVCPVKLIDTTLLCCEYKIIILYNIIHSIYASREEAFSVEVLRVVQLKIKFTRRKTCRRIDRMSLTLA